jgi:hypothetical protein
MGTGIDIGFIREYYQKMTDEDLIHAATHHASGLAPEAQDIVKEEITKRKLDSRISTLVEAKNKNYTEGEIEQYCYIIQKLRCPICQDATQNLNATLTGEVVSFVVFTWRKKALIIGCPDCLDKANRAALAKTAVLGWWAIPWGIIRSIQYIRLNIKNRETNHFQAPNGFLRRFVVSKIAEIETYKEDKEKLQQIIAIQENPKQIR